MKFPMLNITNRDWSEVSDWSTFVLFDTFIYNSNQDFFDKHYKDNLFCDCNGDIYTIIGKQEPVETWRKFLKFIPNVYKTELQLQGLNKRIELEQFRNFVTEKVSNVDKSDFTQKWLSNIKKATSYYEIINDSVD